MTFRVKYSFFSVSIYIWGILGEALYSRNAIENGIESWIWKSNWKKSIMTKQNYYRIGNFQFGNFHATLRHAFVNQIQFHHTSIALENSSSASEKIIINVCLCGVRRYIFTAHRNGCAASVLWKIWYMHVCMCLFDNANNHLLALTLTQFVVSSETVGR